jgi:hypothetical protein
MRARPAGQAALALAGGYLAVLVVTRRRQHRGATDQEVVRPLPGDDLLPAAKLQPTHAITIAAVGRGRSRIPNGTAALGPPVGALVLGHVCNVTPATTARSRRS